jgi:hypothetical protein
MTTHDLRNLIDLIATYTTTHDYTAPRIIADALREQGHDDAADLLHNAAYVVVDLETEQPVDEGTDTVTVDGWDIVVCNGDAGDYRIHCFPNGVEIASGYCEPGYTGGPVYILQCSRIKPPSNVDEDDICYADEWSTCDGCRLAVRTEPDSFDWRPFFNVIDGELWCHACQDRTGNQVIDEYRIEDIGIDDASYFQRRGTSYTQWDEVFIGTGEDAQEAYDDAHEQCASAGWDTDSLPARPRLSGGTVQERIEEYLDFDEIDLDDCTITTEDAGENGIRVVVWFGDDSNMGYDYADLGASDGEIDEVAQRVLDAHNNERRDAALEDASRDSELQYYVAIYVRR